MNVDTRTRILEHNFEAMKLNGFQGLRTDKAIAELGVTKGAFYHYFPDKKSLGYAIVDELVAPMYISAWEKLLSTEATVLECIVSKLDNLKGICDNGNVHLGCTLNNLIQEMSPLDEGFRKRLNRILEVEQRYIQEALAHDKALGRIKDEVDPASTALFIIAALEGAYTVGKSFQSKEMFDKCIEELKSYVAKLAK